MPLIDRLTALFTNPASRPLAIAAVAVLVLVVGAFGAVWALGGGDDDSPAATDAGDAGENATATWSAVSATPTATATRRPTRTATATPTAEPTQTPEPGGANQGSTGGGSSAPQPTATPTLEPTTEPAVAAGGPYCDASSATTPPASVIGLLTIGGADAPAGTTVTLAFDGVPGPSTATAAAGGYRVDFWAATGECANVTGAAVSVIVDGQAFATGAAVGGSPLIRLDIAVP